MRLRCSQWCPDFLFGRARGLGRENGVRKKPRAAARQPPRSLRRALSRCFFPFPANLLFRAPFSLPFAVFLLSFFFLFVFDQGPNPADPKEKSLEGSFACPGMAESRQGAPSRPNLAIPRFGYIFPPWAGFAALRRRRARLNPMAGAAPRARGASVRNLGGAGSGSGSSRWGEAPARRGGGAFCAGSSVMRVFRRLPGSGRRRGAAVSRRRVALPAPAVCFAG